MPEPCLEAFGPLAPLAGVWEGDQGRDVAPSDDRGVEESSYRERLVLEPIAPVDNHEQWLQVLRYRTTAWRIGEADPFHEEVGYWLWDAERQLVMRSFIVPRGVTVLAGARVAPDASSFTLTAELGSRTFGICSNPFLDVEFRTVRFDVTLRVLGPGRFGYEEDTQLQMPGRDAIFHHTDRNVLARVG